MAKTYAVCNQKGGVGKTVTAVSLGIGLAREGKRVLLVDVDPQGSLTASLGYQQPDQMEVTLATVMGQVIQDLPLPNGLGILHHLEGVDLLPANIELSEQQTAAEQVQDIALEKLISFHNHPFQVKDDEEMRKTVESVAQYGVLVPAIARPVDGGQYELVSGHRRKRASELAGRDSMPVIVRPLDDDEATIIMVDANLQREKLLPSEKAFAYKMKLEAMKHQWQRNDLTSAPSELKLTARDRIAQAAGEKSGSTVARYISLTKLLPPLLALVDEGKLSVSSAADYLSDLSEVEQNDILAAMERLKMIPSKGQLVKIKEHSKTGALTSDVIDAILSIERPTTSQVTLKSSHLKQYFPPNYTVQQMEKIIFTLLEGQDQIAV